MFSLQLTFAPLVATWVGPSCLLDWQKMVMQQGSWCMPSAPCAAGVPWYMLYEACCYTKVIQGVWIKFIPLQDWTWLCTHMKWWSLKVVEMWLFKHGWTLRFFLESLHAMNHEEDMPAARVSKNWVRTKSSLAGKDGVGPCLKTQDHSVKMSNMSQFDIPSLQDLPTSQQSLCWQRALNSHHFPLGGYVGLTSYSHI